MQIKIQHVDVKRSQKWEAIANLIATLFHRSTLWRLKK